MNNLTDLSNASPEIIDLESKLLGQLHFKYPVDQMLLDAEYSENDPNVYSGYPENDYEEEDEIRIIQTNGRLQLVSVEYTGERLDAIGLYAHLWYRGNRYRAREVLTRMMRKEIPMNGREFLEFTFCPPSFGTVFGVGLGKKLILPVDMDVWAPWLESILDGVLNQRSPIKSYFCVSHLTELWHENNTGLSIRRRKEDGEGLFAIVLDDIGTKVNAERIRLESTYKVKSRGGNFQWGYSLSAPILDKDQADDLLTAIKDKGLTDRDGVKRNKMVMLPNGYNVKGFGARLVEYSGIKYTVDELIDGLGVREAVNKRLASQKK